MYACSLVTSTEVLDVYRFGIEATLDEVFEAPPLIKHNLKDEAAIHETYVGGRYCANMSVHAMNEPCFRQILQPLTMLVIGYAVTRTSMWRRS